MGSVYSKADHLAVNSLSFLTMSLFWQDVEVCAAGYLPYGHCSSVFWDTFLFVEFLMRSQSFIFGSAFKDIFLLFMSH